MIYNIVQNYYVNKYQISKYWERNIIKISIGNYKLDFGTENRKKWKNLKKLKNLQGYLYKKI